MEQFAHNRAGLSKSSVDGARTLALAYRCLSTVFLNINGEITALAAPGSAAASAQTKVVSVFDRSYLYGDSLYEVARTYEGVFYRLKDHLERLEASAKLCRMVLSQPVSRYAQEMERTLQAFRKANPKTEAYARLIVSRGEGKIGFGLNCLTTPTLFSIIVQPLEEPTDDQLRAGYHMRIPDRLRNHPRALDPAMKSGNYLNNLLAYLEAAAENQDDALLVDGEGFLTEGTTFNFFYIRRGILATPPLDIGILAGITRKQVMTHARAEGLTVREVRFPRERLYEADEAFITSTIKEIFPLTRIDGRPIGSGKPGPLTLKLRASFHRRILSEVR